jgi:hypothetical protein
LLINFCAMCDLSTESVHEFARIALLAADTAEKYRVVHKLCLVCDCRWFPKVPGVKTSAMWQSVIGGEYAGSSAAAGIAHAPSWLAATLCHHRTARARDGHDGAKRGSTGRVEADVKMANLTGWPLRLHCGL